MNGEEENYNHVFVKDEYDFKKIHRNDYLYLKYDGIPLIFSEENEKKHFFEITLKKMQDNINMTKKEDVYSKFLSDENLTKRKLTNIDHCSLMFHLISCFLGIFNLIGIFQIISVMKALNGVFYNSVKYKIKKIEKDEYLSLYDKNFNFYHILFENSLNNQLIDFNLIWFTGGLGYLLLKLTGFRLSSFVFMATNCISLVLLINFKFDENFKNNEYSFLSVLYIGLCWLLLFLGVGASAILSQHIIIDSYMKYKEYYIEYINERIKKYQNENSFELNNKAINDGEDINEPLNKKENNKQIKIERKETIKNKKDNLEKVKKRMEKNKFDYFFMICIITIFGYYLKYVINIVLIYHQNKKDKNSNKEYNFFINICLLYPSSIILSMIIYSFFVCIFTTNIDKKEKKCCKCTCQSKEKEDSFSIRQICGYTIYSQNIILNKNIPKCICLKLCCRTIDNCMVGSCYSILTFCPCKDCLEEEKNENIDEYSLCTPCNCDCVDTVFDKKDECFCYCYQERIKSNWFYKYINNHITRSIFPYIIEYFCLRFTTIGFERKCELISRNNIFNITNDTNYNNTNPINETEINNNTNIIFFNIFSYLANNFTGEINNDSNSIDIIFIFIFLGSFILFFYFTISFSRFIKQLFDLKEKNSKKKLKVIELSEEILSGTHGIFIFNSVFSLAFSIFELSTNNLKDIIEKSFNFLLIPILVNKFFYFTINFYIISFLEATKGLDLIPISPVISTYFSIGEIFIDFIAKYPNDDNIKSLYIIQIIFSTLGSLIAIFMTCSILCISCTSLKLFIKCLFCFFSFLLCFSGFCYDYEHCDDEESNQCFDCSEITYNFYCCSMNNGVCDCDCCCCDLQSPCYSDYCLYNCSDWDCGLCCICCL